MAGWQNLGTDLAALSMGLSRGDEEVDRGHGALVLDGPLTALHHWLGTMHKQCPELTAAAGEVVTTGTLTDAWPVAPGQTWHTRPDDARLPGLQLRFAP